MALEYDLSDRLKEILKHLARRDPKKVMIINKKIKQITNSDEETIEHYKNLRHDLKEFKRVHIETHFVLTFQYNRATKAILFVDFDHHDNIYRR
ncbi:MAG: addiction module toxin RelE [Candidatus Diapherotrites archaeon]|nr:addiction module toxin RelE [Candidatus Diapherotrites archaeon]